MIYVNKVSRVAEHMHGTKVFVYPRKTDAKWLHDFVLANNINKPMDAEDYHVTVAYSSNPIPSAEGMDITLPMLGFIKGWHVFETALGRCLVALIQSTEIEKLNKRLKDMGATSNFPEYIAHMTVSWDHVGDAPTDVPTMSIIFDAYKVEGIDPNWKPKR